MSGAINSGCILEKSASDDRLYSRSLEHSFIYSFSIIWFLFNYQAATNPSKSLPYLEGTLTNTVLNEWVEEEICAGSPKAELIGQATELGRSRVALVQSTDFTAQFCPALHELYSSSNTLLKTLRAHFIRLSFDFSYIQQHVRPAWKFMQAKPSHNHACPFYQKRWTLSRKPSFWHSFTQRREEWHHFSAHTHKEIGIELFNQWAELWRSAVRGYGQNRTFC